MACLPYNASPTASGAAAPGRGGLWLSGYAYSSCFAVRRDCFSRFGLDLGQVDANASASTVEIDAMRHFNRLIELGLWLGEGAGKPWCHARPGERRVEGNER
jgi:hypothetical protein